MARQINIISSLVIFTTMTSINYIDLNRCSVSNASIINNILITLDTIGRSSGTYTMTGLLNAAPPGLGIIAKNNLISRGCTVETN